MDERIWEVVVVKRGESMDKKIIEKWDKYKGDLEKTLRRKNLYDLEYSDLMALVVKEIFNKGCDEYDDPWDIENITKIDNGGYQGTILWLIPRKTYQPCEYEYLMTYVNYGSCSGCDTLLSIQSNIYWEERETNNYSETVIKDIMTLCLHLVQNTIRPYKAEWEE